MNIKYPVFVILILLFLMSCNSKKTTEEQSDSAEENYALSNENEHFMIVGTYTDDESEAGIFLYRLDANSGESEFLSAVEAKNPSYLTLSSGEKYLFATGENGEDESSVSSFLFDKKNGKLSHINTQPTYGADPCYIETDQSASHLFTANYSGSSITVFSIDENGKISLPEMILPFSGSGTDSVRQQKSHLHSVRFSADYKFLFATDLGADKIYRFDAMASVFQGQPPISLSSMIAFDTSAGTGPRHFDFHPNGKYFYLLGELSGEVIVYDYKYGDLIEKQIVQSDTVGARGSGDIHVSPDGKFLYSSNRLEADGIAIFAISNEDGTLTKTGYQPTAKHPRNFAITPNGKLLLVASRDENKIEIYSIDQETGLLSNINNDIEVRKPVCVQFAAAN